MLMWHPASRRAPYKVKYRVSALAATPHFVFLLIFVDLLRFSSSFSHILSLFCPFLSFISLPGMLPHPLTAFQLF
jgi:spore maturation protein SpmB